MTSFKTSLICTFCACILAGFTTATWAEDDDNNWGYPDTESVMPSQISPEYSPQNPYGYSPYPAANTMLPMPAPETRRPWYKRLFSRAAKQASVPINQVPKIPEPKGQETLPVRDPLLRLAKHVQYNGQSLSPGFYLVGLTSQHGGAQLRLSRENTVLMEVPAFTEGVIGSSVASESSSGKLPPPPKKRDKKGADIPEARAGLELSQDGQNAIFTYIQGAQVYRSAPLSVAD